MINTSVNKSTGFLVSELECNSNGDSCGSCMRKIFVSSRTCGRRIYSLEDMTRKIMDVITSKIATST